MNDTNRDIVDTLAGLTLFGDLSRPQLEAVAHTFDEQWFSEGQRILRQPQQIPPAALIHHPAQWQTAHCFPQFGQPLAGP